MLLLVPSVVVIVLPFTLSMIRSLFGASVAVIAIPWVILSLPVALVLCFEYGDQLEKWRHGEIRNGYRAFGFGVLILIVNAVTTLVGFGLVAIFFQK